MCMDAISHMLMNDETIQNKLANPILDLIHKQVLMALYSMDAENRLHEYRQMLPVYLSTDWLNCERILDVLEEAGLLTRTSGKIDLTYRILTETGDSSCGCHG